MSKTTRSLRRFSNVDIFERRDKELKLRKEALTFRHLNKTSIHFFFKQKKEKNKDKEKSKNFDFSLLSNSTTSLLKEISTQNSIRQNLWNKIFNIYQDKDKNVQNNNDNTNKKQILNKTNLGCSNSDMFITEINKINDSKSISSLNKINNSLVNININRQIKKPLNIKENNKEISKEKDKSKTYNKKNSLLFNIKKNYNNYNNIGILKYFQEQKMKKQSVDKKNNITNNIHKDTNNSFGLEKSKSEKYFTKLIDIKTKKIIVKKDSSNDFMDKLREFRVLNYETKINEEKRSNFVENYKNNIDYYDDLSRNLRSTTNLLNKRFLGKMSDYMRFIYFKIEEEKRRESRLIKKIVEINDEIKQLNLKIKRKDLEKNEILKWIYFQIKVKERIISIPSYYKEIIENKDKKDTKKECIPNKVSNRMSFRVSSKPKKFNIENLTLRKSFKIKRLLNQSTKDVTNFKNLNRNLDSENIVSDEEIKKIKNYLKYPIFNDIEELEDCLDIYKNEILFKSKDYYNLKLQIFNDKNHLLESHKKLTQEKNNYEQLIKIKTKELEEIKEITNEKKNMKIEAKKIENTNKLLKDIFQQTNKKVKYGDYPLIDKINSIYETCQLFQLNIKRNTIFERKKKDSHPLIAEMIVKLKFIILTVDSIILEFKYYKEHDKQKSELIKKTKSEIDKKHKDAKNMEQKIKEKQKSIKLLNKIEERNNKIFFLSYRKIDNYNVVSKKNQKQKIKDTKNSIFNFNII